MTYRGVYRDGVVIIQGDVSLRDGAQVEITETRTARTPSTTKKPREKKVTAKRRTTTRKRDPLDGLIGFWKDRPDWKGRSSIAIAAELRDKALGRRRG
jgi:hypothetical protein